MVTQLVDLVVCSLEAPSSYPEPPLLGGSDAVMDPAARISPLREVVDSPGLDVFPSYFASPAGSVYEPVTSPITSSLQEDADYRLPSSPATMDQYLSRDGELLRGVSTDLPPLDLPLTPRPFDEEISMESSVGSPAGEPVTTPSHGMPDLSQEALFDVHQDASELGPLREC